MGKQLFQPITLQTSDQDRFGVTSQHQRLPFQLSQQADLKGFPGLSCRKKELEHREDQINLVLLETCSITDRSAVMAASNFTFQFPFLADCT